MPTPLRTLSLLFALCLGVMRAQAQVIPQPIPWPSAGVVTCEKRETTYHVNSGTFCNGDRTDTLYHSWKYTDDLGVHAFDGVMTRVLTRQTGTANRCPPSDPDFYNGEARGFAVDPATGLHYELVASGSFGTVQVTPGRAPVITGVYPPNGSEGTEVTLVGTTLLDGPGVANVKFNGITAQCTSLSLNVLKVLVPRGATSGPITITTSAGTAQSADFLIGFTLAVTPPQATLRPGRTQAFAPVFTGTSGTAITWELPEADSGAITQSGSYTAPTQIPARREIPVRASWTTDRRIYADATVTLLPDILLEASSTGALLRPGETATITLTVRNHQQNAALQMDPLPSTDGSLRATQDGPTHTLAYTAPLLFTGRRSVTLTVRAAEDPAIALTLTFTLLERSLTLTPAGPLTLTPGRSQTFQAVTAGVDNPVITWSLDPPTAPGTLAGGTYTAPPTALPQETRLDVVATLQNPPMSSRATIILPASRVDVTVVPSGEIALAPNEEVPFTAMVTNANNTSVLWEQIVDNVSTVVATGTSRYTYRAPSDAPLDADQVITLKATSQEDPSRSFTVQIRRRRANVDGSLTPSMVSLDAGATQTFTASLRNTATPRIQTWSLSDTTLGSLTVAGDLQILYTAPLTPPRILTYVTLTATPASDPTKTITATIALQPLSLTIPDTGVALAPGQSHTFTAVLKGSNAGVTWRIRDNGPGTLTQDGTYTAPIPGAPQETRVTLEAVPKDDETKAVQVTLTLTAPRDTRVSGVRISPPIAALHAPVSATEVRFVAQVIATGDVPPTVHWTLDTAPSGVSIDQSGLLRLTQEAVRALLGATTPTLITVRATSQANITRSATATLTLLPCPADL